MNWWLWKFGFDLSNLKVFFRISFNCDFKTSSSSFDHWQNIYWNKRGINELCESLILFQRKSWTFIAIYQSILVGLFLREYQDFWNFQLYMWNCIIHWYLIPYPPKEAKMAWALHNWETWGIEIGTVWCFKSRFIRLHLVFYSFTMLSPKG